MQNQLEVIPAGFDQKPVVARLMQLYLYDATHYSGVDVNEDGVFAYRYLDLYWEENERFPNLFRVDGKWAGFGLINSFVMLPQNEGANSMAEFFIMRKYRRGGYGRTAFNQLLAAHPGRWEIRVDGQNIAGCAFWPVVIDEVTRGNYECIEAQPTTWEGPIYSFDYPTEPNRA